MSAREQAARWFSRLQGEDAHPQREEFERWLAATPENAREYQAFRDLWDDFSSTRRSEALAQALERRQQRSLRKRLGGVVAGMALLAIGTFAWHAHRQGPVELNLQTAIGEQRSVDLRDGSRLHLNAATQVKVEYDATRRHVQLEAGELILEVSRNPQRPFVVDSNLARVTVLGTRFAVNRLPDRLRVSVDHGRVQVASTRQPGQVVQLRNDEVLEVYADGSLKRLPLSAANAFAFERGNLVFDNADLTEIAASLSRYRPLPVRALDAGRPSPRIDAVVQLDDIEGFLAALPHIAAVRIEQHADGTLLHPR